MAPGGRIPWADDLASLFLRLGVGLTFLHHGYDKVQEGLDYMVPFLSKMGAPMPQALSPLVILAESIGGAFLILGFATRGCAFLHAAIMIVAIVGVHRGQGFTMHVAGGQVAGYEWQLLLLAASLALLLMGGGSTSLDRFLFPRKEKGKEEPKPSAGA